MNYWTNLGHDLTNDTINKLADGLAEPLRVKEGNGVGQNIVFIVAEK